MRSMPQSPGPSPILLHPRRTLLSLFIAWKGLLLAIAVGSGFSGPAYDTSTTLALAQDEHAHAFDPVTRLTRWDAIYFTASARRGYLYEQEWAFARGLPVVISFLSRLLDFFTGLWPVQHHHHHHRHDDPGQEAPSGAREAALGVFVSHAAHLAAVMTLYDLVRTLSSQSLSPPPRRNDLVPFLAALLHALSPAGLFLSAPYAESSFALLTFAGFSLLARAAPLRRSWGKTALQVAAGAVLGLATAFRTNGVLNGIPFAAECVLSTLRFVRSRLGRGSKGQQQQQHDRSFVGYLLGLFGPLAGGVLVAAGSAVPQVFAYLRYCSGPSEPRPWCHRTLPSIYAFVQEHYWGTGFLRYWTMSNLPLFLLAAPVLTIMSISGVEVLRQPSTSLGIVGRLDTGSRTFVQAVAAGQVVLATLALSTYHVQVVTRLASGYPIWYWWLANCLAGQDEKRSVWGERAVIFMVMYAMIQGGLFVCFLPPA
ncbi:mannosyltransferase [Sodiomyces alkalinus F11]|uniref:GPI mannosyltransferase 2 n=1 Tax=Sodiomyces alkalinus (strain CBS 110278 / VKM F-3762 / F11) TaxID=1314773 RepID=A0A3N2PPM0_SODAK|nr:mannosyltransferase [Sodiomyces alkalinus F11]ROT36451.1 mannosyltransferase [Sodiomyces alkalinus F11]